MRALMPALVAIALWSTNATVARHALAQMPVALVQFLQFAGAAAALAAAGLVSGRRREESTLPPAALLIGLVGFVGTMVLQYLAFTAMPVGRANLIAYSWPLMAAAAFIALGRAVHPLRLAVLACAGFLGAGILIVDSAGEAGGGAPLAGALAAFGSAACMAFYTVAIGRHAVEARRILLPSALTGALLCLVWCVAARVNAQPSPGWLAALYLGAGPMALGYLLWSKALGRDSGGRLAVLAYLTPVFSTALLAADGEPFDRPALAGAALVILASLAAGMDRRPSHG